MNTLPLSLYDIVSFGLGGDSFQTFVDRYEEIYDTTTIDGFDFAPTQLGYTFSQLVASVGAKVLPTYVDPESPGYEMPLGEATGVTDSIPTMKNRYRLNRVTVREKLQLAQKFGTALPSSLNAEFRDVFMKLLDEGIDAHIQSFYNALNHQRHQIVSTGQFVINSTNNPRGIKNITIQFGVPTANKDTLTTTARWWTSTTHSTANEGSASDPLGYLKNRVKYIRRTAHYAGPLRMEISRDLLEDMLTHSKVLTQIGLRMYPAAASDSTGATALSYAKNMSDEALVDEIRRIIRVDRIVERDTFSYVSVIGTDGNGDPDLVQQSVENFNSKNVAFLPDGALGSIQGVEPISLGYDADKVARYMGGRLLFEQKAEPSTHSIYIDSEAAQICVPNVPQYMFISTVTA